jgi:sugar phosphate isomerase/epimerase
MKFGCSMNLGSYPPADAVKAGRADEASYDEKLGWLGENIRHLMDTGYDYLEFAVGMVAPPAAEQEFAKLAQVVRDSGLRADAFNCFIPASVPVTGPKVDMEQIRAYLDIAMPRMEALGGERVVFGSAGARNVPGGFSRDTAEAQIIDFLNVAGDIAAGLGQLVVIEPLNRAESNIINLVSDATRLARKVDHPNVKVLADFWHVGEEKEPLSDIVDAGPLLKHVHVADSRRWYPGSGSYDYKAFFHALKDAGYDERISLECSFDDFRKDTVSSLAFMKDVLTDDA